MILVIGVDVYAPVAGTSPSRGCLHKRRLDSFRTKWLISFRAGDKLAIIAARFFAHPGGTFKRTSTVIKKLISYPGMKACLPLLLALVSLTAFALTEQQQKSVMERIEPVGKVCLEGDSSCGVATVASSGPKSGEDVFNSSCMACHSTGAGGAPKTGDKVAWAPRIAKGMDALYSSGVNGVAGTGMIAKGGCMSCSDDEVNAAVDYMVKNSQ